MMRIGEVARRAGVTPRALRYYEEKGLLRARRDHNGYRVYEEDTVHAARNIARLLRAGLSSEDVARFGDCLRRERMDRSPDCAALLEVYTARLAMLDRRIEALTELRGRLAEEARRLRAAMAAHASDPDRSPGSREPVQA